MDGSAVIFLPIIIFFGFFGILIIGFFALVGKLFVNAKNDAYTGEVTDKLHNTRRDMDDDHKINHFYVLVVKTDAGKVRKLGVSQQLYDQFNKGNKIKKEKGKLWPEKG